MRHIVRGLAWCCLLELAATWLAIAVLGDRAWWTVVLLFGPRWILSLPCFGMIPWLLADVRRALMPALAGAAIVTFGLLDFHLGLHRTSPESGIPFRVLELNADGGQGAILERALSEFRARKADVIVVVECGPTMAEAIESFDGYHAHSSDFRGLCLLSHGAIISWEQRDQKDVFEQGGAGYIVRAVVNSPAGPMRLGLVHTATPRHALDSYFSLHNIPNQGPQTRANINQRDEEARFARDWIMQGEKLPTIIAGDLNLTTESAIYKRYWGDFRNAFGRAGWGTGYTKFTRHWGVRIDHVLTSDDIGTHAAFVGPDVGSDHRPLIVDLVLPNHRTSTTR